MKYSFDTFIKGRRNIRKGVIAIVSAILIFALVKGCYQSRKDKVHIETLMALTDSFAVISERAVKGWEESKKRFNDSLEFERGQRALAEAQKERTENELNVAHTENAKLLKKYKDAQYKDTSMVSAPAEFIHDCHECFTKLEACDKLSLKYKSQVIDWGYKYKKETSLLQNRCTQVEAERAVYIKTTDSLRNEYGKLTSSIKPRGRLYLSWGVLWSPWPTAAGAGIMYQNKRNVIYGAKGYYGVNKLSIETTINFPLSLRFK